MSYVAHMNEPCHTYEWVISHVRMCLITLMNRLAHHTTVIHIRDITHPWLWHDASMIATWLIHTRDTPYSYVWHDANKWSQFVSVLRRYWRDEWHGVGYSDMMHRDTPYSYVWHDVMCDMTHSRVFARRRNSFIYVTQHASFTRYIFDVT